MMVLAWQFDLGLPLHAETNGPEWLPPVAGLTQPADDFLGIVISHPHQDHYGLLAHVHETVPIAMGQAARRILTAASRFVPGPTVQLGNLELRTGGCYRLAHFPSHRLWLITLPMMHILC